VLIKPIFKGGIGKKGKSGLIGRAGDLATAMREKERLFFVEHRVGNQVAKAEGVTFEGAVPAAHEIYVSIADATRYRAPTLTITHHGGVDIEALAPDQLAVIPFDALTGFKGFIVANALDSIDAPREIISPLVQHLPKLWDLFSNYGMSVLELNPIRMMPTGQGRLSPVACDFKCSFDGDDPTWHRLSLPDNLESASYSASFTSTGSRRATCCSSSAARPTTRTSMPPSGPWPMRCGIISTPRAGGRCTSSSGAVDRT